MDESNNQPILIYGSGRSGTTWIQDVLAEANEYGTVFEPLNQDAVKGAEELANLYVQSGSSHPELSQFMNSVISGSLNSIWASVRVRPDRLFPPPHVMLTRKGAGRAIRVSAKALKRWAAARKYRNRPKIIKFIRANLMIEWMQAQYGLRSAIVIRHPCAVLASVCQRSNDEEWAYPAMDRLLLRYLEQDALVEDRLKEKMAEIESFRSMAGTHAAIWCIENAHLIAADGQNQVPIACYEHLATNDESTWRELTKALSLEAVPSHELLLQPSQQASYTRRKDNPEQHMPASWQEILTDEQKSTVQSVLDLFEVDSYDVQNPLPLRSLTPAAR